MFSIASARYFVFGKPTDMRKSFDGLCGLVTNRLGQDPMNGDVFIFINRPRNRIKMLRWEPGGYVLFYKRLEKGTFALPGWEKLRSGMAVDYTELVMIITGISLKNARRKERFLPPKHVDKLSVNLHGSMT